MPLGERTRHRHGGPQGGKTHAHRLEYEFFHHLRIGLARDRFRQQSGQPESGVRIRINCARAREQPVRFPGANLLAQRRVVVTPIHHRLIPQAGRVTQNLIYGKRRDGRIEPRNMFSNGAGEVELAFGGQHGHGRCGQHFGGGPQPEQSIRGYRSPGFQVGRAEPLDIRQARVDHDSNGRPRCSRGCQFLIRQRLDSGEIRMLRWRGGPERHHADRDSK